MEKESHNIYDNEQLTTLIDSRGVVNSSLVIGNTEFGDFIQKLENVNEIHGDLVISSENIISLGSLKVIKGNLWATGASSLISLGKLSRIEGDANFRYSGVQDLGELKYVGGKLSLRDTPVNSVQNLTEVCGDLFLPTRFENSIAHISVGGKIRFWSDKNTTTISELNVNSDWGPSNNQHFSDVHTTELKSGKRALTGEFVVKKCFNPSELNSYVVDNIIDFFSFVEEELSSIYGDNYSFFDSLFRSKKNVVELNQELPTLKIDKRRNQDFSAIKKLADNELKVHKNKPGLNVYYSTLKKYKEGCDVKSIPSKYWLRYDEHKLSFAESTGKGRGKFIYFIENTILQIFSTYVLSLQNKFRVSRGIPKIGEGWVSETDLFQSIKAYLTGFKVVQHGKPKWLGRQHVDIWIPKLKVGVEFHGKQHFEPVAHFGGEEAFVRNQERDKRKKELFLKNDATLIEVTHGYSFDELKKTLDKHK